jgi:hypothetical protein
MDELETLVLVNAQTLTPSAVYWGVNVNSAPALPKTVTQG